MRHDTHTYMGHTIYRADPNSSAIRVALKKTKRSTP